jgi:osmotically inducible protein OsmC
MKTQDVHVELLPNMDWRLTFHHAALDDTVITLAALPETQRAGVARKLLAASAAYCFASTLDMCLRQKGVKPHEISAEATINMDTHKGVVPTIQSIDLDVRVTVPREDSDDVDQCRTLLGDGSLVTKSLQQSIPVNHTITQKCAN